MKNRLLIIFTLIVFGTIVSCSKKVENPEVVYKNGTVWFVNQSLYSVKFPEYTQIRNGQRVTVVQGTWVRPGKKDVLTNLLDEGWGEIFRGGDRIEARYRAVPQAMRYLFLAERRRSLLMVI